jgi:hypothetical protein
LQVAEEGTRDRPQALQRIIGVASGSEQRAVATVTAVADRLDQFVLAGEVSVDAARAEARLLDHVLDRGLVKSLPRKAVLGGAQDLLAAQRQGFGFHLRHDRFLRSPGAA